MSHRARSGTAPAGRGSDNGVFVEPGCKTGVYYILFSGLRKGTRWNHVKDHLKREGGLNGIGDVQVFTEPMSGWAVVYGADAFRAAKEYLQKHKRINGREVNADFRNESQETFVRGLKDAQPVTATPKTTDPAAFSHQIPPLDISESAPCITQNPLLPYPDPSYPAHVMPAPYDPSAATGYGDSTSYEQDDMEYYALHPTRNHDCPPAQRTGHEGSDLYAADIDALADKYATPSVQDTPGSTDADFKISVKRHGEGSITQEMVIDFVTTFAPISRLDGAVQRIHILKSRKKPPRPSTQALIVFQTASICNTVRSGLLDKELHGIRLILGPSDVAESPEESEQKAERKPPTEPRPKPEGSDPRSRKEQKRDRRKEQDHYRKDMKLARAAAAAQGSAGVGDPGAPAASSSGGQSAKDAPARRDPGPLVVNGSYPRSLKPKPPVVDGTTPLHLRHKPDEKKRRK